MDNQTEKFIKDLQSIELTPAQRATLKLKLIERINYRSNFWRRSVQVLIPVMATFLLMVIVAQGAEPGSPLYSIKVKINEPIEGATKITQDQKIQWATEKQDRRLKELEHDIVKSTEDQNKALEATPEIKKDNSQAVDTKEIDKQLKNLDKEIQDIQKQLDNQND